MSFVTKVVSAEDVMDALKYDYDRYLVSYITHAKVRRPMSTVFDVMPVMNALAAEITDQGDPDTASDRVVKTITDQGVDKITASAMALSGRGRLLAVLGNALGDLSQASLNGGSIDILEHGDVYIMFGVEES